MFSWLTIEEVSDLGELATFEIEQVFLAHGEDIISTSAVHCICGEPL